MTEWPDALPIIASRALAGASTVKPMARPIVTSMIEENPTDPSHYASQCVAAVGRELSAYLVGVDSVAELDILLDGADVDSRERVARRLAVTADVIRMFAIENLVSLTGPWLREVAADGTPTPASIIRSLGDDDGTVKNLLDAAAAWVAEHRLALSGVA